MNGAPVTRRLNGLKECLTCKSCSLFPQVDVLITYTLYEICAYYTSTNPPHRHHYYVDEGWVQGEKLIIIAKWFEIMPKSRKGHFIFPHKRNLYKHTHRDTPTPPVYLEAATTPPPWVQILPPWLVSIANIVQRHNLAKFGAFSPCAQFFRHMACFV